MHSPLFQLHGKLHRIFSKYQTKYSGWNSIKFKIERCCNWKSNCQSEPNLRQIFGYNIHQQFYSRSHTDRQCFQSALLLIMEWLSCLTTKTFFFHRKISQTHWDRRAQRWFTFFSARRNHKANFHARSSVALSNSASESIWHAQLGHINPYSLTILERGNADGMKMKPNHSKNLCNSCVHGKDTKEVIMADEAQTCVAFLIVSAFEQKRIQLDEPRKFLAASPLIFVAQYL